MANLLFIMTPGTSLSVWADSGAISRELKPYFKYAERGVNVRIISFGPNKNNYTIPHKNIEVFHARLGIFWAYLLPITHRAHYKWADVIKTNQSYLSWVFALAANYFEKPIMLRCGYVRGEYLETTVGDTLTTKIYKSFEGWAFRAASAVAVPTKELAEWVVEKYHVRKIKVSVLPNWVDTELFRPSSCIERQANSVLSIGRLHKDKQHDLLIKACALIPGCNLTIIGEGPERRPLEVLAKKLGVNLHAPGISANSDLPGIINKNQIFAVTSVWEGHPKAVIEALACGIPCVAVSGVGISNLLSSNRAALMASASPEGLAGSIEKLFANHDLSHALAQRGRKYVVDNFSFQKNFDRESEVLLGLTKI